MIKVDSSTGDQLNVLTNFGPRDLGKYLCRATNILGSTERVVNVYHGGKC